ncbi:hypothetical protein BC940DRAFT_366950 [Gongronella butleri]|nr:hypothetical protein BC940DRAFT_366950 [Gongronella butleri]
MATERVTLEWKRAWHRKLKEQVNCLLVGNPFGRQNRQGNDILIGSLHGRVLYVNRNKDVQLLCESKGGPVQCVLIQDLDGSWQPTVLVGDCDGKVTFFRNQQIQGNIKIGRPIHALVHHENEVGDHQLVAGDSHGSVTSFGLHATTWKQNLDYYSNNLDLHDSGAFQYMAVKCLHSVKLQDDRNARVSCLLACSGASTVFVVYEESIENIRTPTPIESICSGFFVTKDEVERLRTRNEDGMDVDDEERPPTTATVDVQVLLAGQDGHTYIMIDFEIYPYFQAEWTVTHVLRFRPRSLPSKETDMVICAGQSDVIAVYHHGKRVSEIKCKDWPQCIALGDLDQEGKDSLVVGYEDQSIDVFSFDLTLPDSIDLT